MPRSEATPAFCYQFRNGFLIERLFLDDCRFFSSIPELRLPGWTAYLSSGLVQFVTCQLRQLTGQASMEMICTNVFTPHPLRPFYERVAIFRSMPLHA